MRHSGFSATDRHAAAIQPDEPPPTMTTLRSVRSWRLVFEGAFTWDLASTSYGGDGGP
jgi:hypothetical protein